MDTVAFAGLTWGQLLSKAMFLLVVIAVAYGVQHVVVRLISRLLSRTQALPQASILTNIARVVIWVLALVTVLNPVFGIQPTTLFGALGISSIVISFGLKDTISNIIGGLALMISKVVQPGDYVTISGITGTVSDLTWRHTIVQNRAGDHVVIPNSVLNTTAVVRQAASTECACTVDFTMEAGRNPNDVATDIIETAQGVVGDRLRDGMESAVFFGSITPYGVKGQLWVYVKPDIPFGGVRNDIVRALACKPYFSTFDEMAAAGEPSTF
ncbi:MAG: mechanosensitive ion channel [Coriobacteriia bacterium]|nr:mechanosensitive ion channel [Coriobacteriia bacterium]MBS5477893.1 mechanosensitive ion channel [Coriobacteriia bacterium]